MSIEAENLRISILRTYLLDIIKEVDENLKGFNVDYLSSDPANYSLDKIPTESTVEKWITGMSIFRDVYNLRSRMNYSADEISNIENIGFYENFEEKIKEKNKNKELPEIVGIEAIRCLNCGTLVLAESNTCEFNIQIQIEYRR